MEHVFENGITKGKFTRFVAPSVLMFIVISMYSIVDSIFVANFVGTNAFAALNLVYPLQGLVWGLSIMLAVGSSSLVAINLGQGNTKKANQRFTLICLFALVFALVIVLLSFIFFEDLITFLGANDTLRADATIYGKILIAATPAAFLGTLFEYFIRVEGKPNFTLMLYILGGVTNLVLDFIFLVPFDMGIEGAAYGTLAGMVVVMLVGGFHFLFHSVKLKFTKPSFDIKFILHSISNGSSELVTESSIGITIFAFNLIAIRLAGEAGVAAVGIVMDTQFLLVSIHLGYVCGVLPLLSYYYGAKKYDVMNIFLRYSKRFIFFASLSMAILGFLGAPLISRIFAPVGSEVYQLGVIGVRLLGVSFLFSGLNVFASGFFSAFGHGHISAIISLCRSLVFVILFGALFAFLFGIQGLWISIIATELLTAGFSLFLIKKFQSSYHYQF